MKVTRKTILDIDIDTVTESDELLGVVAKIQAEAKAGTTKERTDKNSFPLRPSSALKSDRDLHYALLNYFKPGTIPVTEIEGRNCMLLQFGHAVEAHLVRFIEGAFEVPFKAQKINFGELQSQRNPKGGAGANPARLIDLGGELDFVIKLPSGELVIADSKSSADFPFKKLDFLKEDHVAQINLYLHSDFAKQHGIKRAWVFYYNKNDSNLKIAEFSYDKRLAEATIARFQRILTNVENGGAVPLQHHVLGVDWQAAYSNFRDYDWREYETPVEGRQWLIGQTNLLPKAFKEKLNAFVRTYGTKAVKFTDGTQMYAIKQGPTLVLKEVSADGFTY